MACVEEHLHTFGNSDIATTRGHYARVWSSFTTTVSAKYIFPAFMHFHMVAQIIKGNVGMIYSDLANLAISL